MGFVLSVLYFLTYYLTPTTVFGPLAVYRVELILAVFVLFISLPKLPGSFIWKTPQSLALIGLAFAVLLSILIGMRWATGGLLAFLAFIPNAFAYFLICLHFNSKKKLQGIALMILFVCTFVIVHGCIELQNGAGEDQSAQAGDSSDSYLLEMRNDEGVPFYRLKGLGEISDPNDFAQVIVSEIPLVFLFWRPKKLFRNTVFVILPACFLLFGAFLTHSRGAVLAILAMAVVALRRRIGTIPSLVLACALFAAASALNFTGGREISASAGQDRTGLWSEGLELLKSHPFFGVGFNNFSDYAGLTAHNSLVVCAAELGTFGLCFWTLFLFPTVRDALAIASPKSVTEGNPIVQEGNPIVQVGRLIVPGAQKVEEIDKAEINRLGRIVVLSLTGFLVTGWFLSRSFVMTFFLLGESQKLFSKWLSSEEWSLPACSLDGYYFIPAS